MTHRVFGYMSNDASLTAAACRQIGEELGLDEGGALGVSWLQQERVLERKNPQSQLAAGAIWDSIGEVSSRVIAACVQPAGMTSAKEMDRIAFNVGSTPRGGSRPRIAAKTARRSSERWSACRTFCGAT